MQRPNSMVLWKAILLTALCSTAVWGLWWWGLVHSPRTQVQARARASLVEMERTIARELSRAETTGLALGAWWAQEHASLEDLSKLQSVIAFLENGGMITNLILSREDGDSACIVKKDGEWNLILFRAGMVSRRLLLRGGQWVAGQGNDSETYRAQERHWYRFGAALSAPAWTPEAYRFFTTRAGGFSYVVPVRDARGALEGVVGVDVSLEELTQFIWDHQPTPGTRMVVSDAGGRLLVPPRITAMLDPGARVDHQLMPVPPAFPEAEPAGPNAVRAPVGAFIAAGGAYAVPGKPRMNLHVAIPEEDLFPGLRPRRIAVFVLALAIVLGVAWSLLDVHRRFVRPMQDLALEASSPSTDDGSSGDYQSDVWEIKQVGQQLRVAGRAVQERNLLLNHVEHSQRVDSVGMMAPGIMHDVNNQLAVVLGQIALCRTLYEDHPALHPRLRQAEEAAVKCSDVLRGLLDYSRPDPGEREPMSLNASVEHVVALLGPVAGKSIEVRKDLDPEAPAMFGEPQKIQQILVNLGMNARDAMPEGGRLTFRTFRSEGNVCLEVRDTGCGMTRDVMERVFEPFFSTKARGKGTGLGLAMVANIVAAHGGSIRVDSQPGEGTAFRIEFPLSLRKRGETRAAAKTEEGLASPHGK